MTRKKTTKKKSGCWFQRFFIFTSDPWGFMIQFDVCIFFKWVGLKTPTTPRKFNMEPENGWFPKGISFPRNFFSGSILNFRGVEISHLHLGPVCFQGQPSLRGPPGDLSCVGMCKVIWLGAFRKRCLNPRKSHMEPEKGPKRKKRYPKQQAK